MPKNVAGASSSADQHNHEHDLRVAGASSSSAAEPRQQDFRVAGASSSSAPEPREQDAPATPRLRFPEFRDAGEWEVKTLKDTCQMQAGKFVAASDIKEKNEGNFFPCYGGNGLRGFTATSTHEGVYPLIGRQGALCGNVKLASGKFHATEHALVATPRQKVEVVWLYYVLNLLNLNRFATGQAQPGLSVDVLEKISVAIPPTLAEQQRIADCLSSLDALIAAQARKVDALKSHKKGLMQQLFPRDGETQPRLRFPEFRDAGEWEKLPLGEVTTKTDQRNTNGKSYPVYSISNKTGFTPQSEQFEGVDSEKRGYDISLYKLVGQHTFAYNPARINVGSIGYSGELNNIIISSLYVCFKTHPSTDDMFLRHFFDTNHFEKAVRDHVEGGIRSYLFYENFARISIALPTLAEQQRIADCLSSLDDLITAATRQLATLKTHKQGLMQQLFPNVAGASSSADIHTREQDAPATHP